VDIKVKASSKEVAGQAAQPDATAQPAQPDYSSPAAATSDVNEKPLQ